MIAIPQIKIMETQTPYGRTTVKIIRSPNVINYAKRGSLIATRWLASSPYAKYQEIVDEMNREYLRKLAEYSQQMKRWKMEMENYTATQIKQMQQRYNDMLKQQIRGFARTYSDLLYMKLVNSGLNPSKAKEVVLDFLTKSYVPFSEATDIVVNLEKKYKPKIQPTTPAPSYSSGSSSRSSSSRSSHSSSSLIKPVYQDIVYSGSTPSLATQPSISSSTSIEQVNNAARNTSSTSYREVPTNVPGVTAVVNEKGEVTGYHDNIRGVCTMNPPSYVVQTPYGGVSTAYPESYNPYTGQQYYNPFG